MSFIRSFKLAGAFLIGLIIAACDTPPPAENDNPPSLDLSQPVRVALLTPTGSNDTQREAIGRAIANAAEMAHSDLAGIEIVLSIYPTAGDPAQAAEAARQALDEGAAIIVGPLFGLATTAVAPVAASGDVPVLSLSNNPEIAGGNVYILGTTYSSVAERLVGFTAARGLSRLGVVHPEGVEGEQARRAVAQAADARNAELVATGAYPLSIEGITKTAMGIADSMRSAGADAVIFTDGPTGGLNYATETLRGLGVRDAQFVGLQRWDVSPQAMAQPGLQGGWFAASDPGLQAQFEQRYLSQYGTQPHPLAGLAYDGVAAVGALIAEAKAEGANDPFSTARLTQPQGFAGVNGIFRFRADGTSDRALAIFEVRDGAAQVLDPARRSFGASGS